MAPSADPPHKGLLREDILTLRRLFGYCDDTETPNSPATYLGTKGQRKAKIQDVRFLCIDIDALQEDNQAIRQFHIGISILDTRSVHTLVAGSPGTKQTTPVIESHHFVVGKPKFSRKKSNKFLFGPFETISLSDLKRELETMTAHRDVVLVFHGGDRERWILGRLDIDIHALYTIDTLNAAQHPLQLSYRYSLEKLLDELGIPFANLHGRERCPFCSPRPADDYCQGRGAAVRSVYPSGLAANLDGDCSSSTAPHQSRNRGRVGDHRVTIPGYNVVGRLCELR